MKNDTRINKLKRRLQHLYPSLSFRNIPLKEIEEKLNVTMPEDWIKISSFYKGAMLGSLWLFAPDFKGPGDNIVEETMKLRTSAYLDKPLPREYVVLYNESPSCILMKTETQSSKKTSIIYCGHEDFNNLCNNRPLQFDPKIFPSFTDFFEYLLDEEEKERRENKI